MAKFQTAQTRALCRSLIGGKDGSRTLRGAANDWECSYSLLRKAHRGERKYPLDKIEISERLKPSCLARGKLEYLDAPETEYGDPLVQRLIRDALDPARELRNIGSLYLSNLAQMFGAIALYLANRRAVHWDANYSSVTVVGSFKMVDGRCVNPLFAYRADAESGHVTSETLIEPDSDRAEEMRESILGAVPGTPLRRAELLTVGAFPAGV